MQRREITLAIRVNQMHDLIGFYIKCEVWYDMISNMILKIMKNAKAHDKMCRANPMK